ncbi:MAG: glycoside hydrolase family 25 protein [Oscillospiraceae bacterium]|jgi:lysozyme
MSTYSRGIDVSEHQGTIDWDSVYGSIDFAMLRAGYGRGNIDKQFVRNITECNRLGIPCGVYWFSYALTATDAAQEALYCLAAIEPYTVEYPVCFDFEYASVEHASNAGVTVTKALASAMAQAFCGTLEANFYYAMLYSNPDYLKRYFDSDTAARYDLWLASWQTNPNPTSPPQSCGIWQYGATTISGIAGNVDGDISYNDYPQILRDYGLNNLAQDVPAPWAAEAWEWATAEGILDGLYPQNNMTREMGATMLYRFAAKYGML